MIRLKRILAFFLDWMLCMTPFALLFFAFTGIMIANPSIGNSPIIAVLSVLMALLILATFGTFLLRDAIFKRSPAKRLLKLYIYDNKTLQPATGEQCVLKNLFIPSTAWYCFSAANRWVNVWRVWWSPPNKGARCFWKSK